MKKGFKKGFSIKCQCPKVKRNNSKYFHLSEKKDLLVYILNQALQTNAGENQLLFSSCS